MNKAQVLGERLSFPLGRVFFCEREREKIIWLGQGVVGEGMGGFRNSFFFPFFALLRALMRALRAFFSFSILLFSFFLLASIRVSIKALNTANPENSLFSSSLFLLPLPLFSPSSSSPPIFFKLSRIAEYTKYQKRAQGPVTLLVLVLVLVLLCYPKTEILIALSRSINPPKKRKFSSHH